MCADLLRCDSDLGSGLEADVILDTSPRCSCRRTSSSLSDKDPSAELRKRMSSRGPQANPRRPARRPVEQLNNAFHSRPHLR